jgi:hypothetical protein
MELRVVSLPAAMSRLKNICSSSSVSSGSVLAAATANRSPPPGWARRSATRAVP